MGDKIKLLNFELTTACPLRCPQCYCSLNTGKNMPKETAFYWIDNASDFGVNVINLSGGETMCYPHLYEVVRHAHNRDLKVNVALSGFAFNTLVYKELCTAGVDGFFVSLNGSTDQINSYSRNGFDLAIEALNVLKKAGCRNTTVNWVMQASNADDFENLIRLAEEYQVSRVVVIALKPDSSNELTKMPSKQQVKYVASIIRKYTGKVQIAVESCYSQMLAVLGESFFFGNTNIGEEKGCMAGRMFASVNVDGLLSPCRHLYYFEKWDTLQEYWENSEILRKIRNVEKDIREPCLNCKYGPFCRHCLAVTACIDNEIYLGNRYCPLANCEH